MRKLFSLPIYILMKYYELIDGDNKVAYESSLTIWLGIIYANLFLLFNYLSKYSLIRWWLERSDWEMWVMVLSYFTIGFIGLFLLFPKRFLRSLTYSENIKIGGGLAILLLMLSAVIGTIFTAIHYRS